MNDLSAVPPGAFLGRAVLVIGVIRVIEDQITTLRPYNARYTGDHRSIVRKRYAEMITRVSSDLLGPPPGELAEPITLRDKLACVWKQLLAAPVTN